jgi:cysteine desulfurase
MHEATGRIHAMRDRLFARLRDAIPDLVLNGPKLESGFRLVNNLNVQFPGVDGHTLMVTTPEVCISSGSACTATSTDPSHVLQAIGLDPDAVRSSIRFGLSRFTTVEEIDRAAELLVASWMRLRRSTV